MVNLSIINNENGKQLVSAKELYLGLGLNKAVWSRWYPVNIEKNEFFKENIDWVGVQHNVEGNGTMDFAISIDFAKHIAMMARTEKSHEYRNYFVDMEKKLKEVSKPMCLEDLIIMQANSVKELKATVDTMKTKTEVLENRMSNLDCTNIEGTPRQRLNAIVKKYGFDKGLDFRNAWHDFVKAYNTAYHTNLKRKKDTYMTKNKLKNLSTPDYIERAGMIEDALRVADKLLNNHLS